MARDSVNIGAEEMERNRESSRRGTSTSSSLAGSFSSLSRRRPRSTAFRGSFGVSDADEEGNDTVRDQSNVKKNRPSRRRRLRKANESFHVGRYKVSSDESSDEDNEEDEPLRCVSTRRTNRTRPQCMGDEVIGVSVPRKARSASAKRSQEWFPVGRQHSSSSPLGTSAASPSSPSSNVSSKTTGRMKPVSMKSRGPKTSKVSISESEVEVAQFLYGLTRLQSPLKSECSQLNFNHNLSNEVSVSVVSKASSPRSTPVSPPSSQPMILPQHSSSISAAVMTPQRKKPGTVQLEDGSNSTMMMACLSKPSVCSNVENNSVKSVPASSPKTEGDKDSSATKAVVLSSKSEKNTRPSNSGSSKTETSLLVSLPLQTSIPDDLPLAEENPNTSSTVESKHLISMETNLQTAVAPTTKENGALDANLQASVDPTQKESSTADQDVSALLISDVKPEPPKIVSPVSGLSAAAVMGTKVTNFEIDLMAPPENAGLDDDVPDERVKNTPQASNHKLSPVSGEGISKTEVIANLDRKMETEEKRLEQKPSILDLEEKSQTKEAVEVVALNKQSYDEKKNLDKCDNKQPRERLSRSTERSTDKTVPPLGIMTSTSNPISLTFPSWPSGPPSFGFLGSSPANLSELQSLQAAMSMEGNCAIPNPPFVMPPCVRPNRCATHCFIARFIHQQQIVRLNPFWHAMGPATPYNLNILPPSEALLFGAGSVTRNPNLIPNSNIGSSSVVTLNEQKPVEKVPNSFADSQRKQPKLPQSAQQPRTGGTKSSSLAENAGLLSASGPPGAPASMNTNLSSITSDPQYLGMLHSNYGFPLPPAYRAHITQQLQLVGPSGGTLYPSHLTQIRSHSLPHTQNPTTSSWSSSSQQHLQAQHHCFPTLEPQPESRPSGPGSIQFCEGIAESQITLAQRKLPDQNTSCIQKIPHNFVLMEAAFSAKQQHPSDPSLQTSLTGVKVTTGSLHREHVVLQSLPDLRRTQYQLDGSHIDMANQSEAPAKSSTAKGSNKLLESSHPQSTAVTAQQQLQKQAIASTISAAGASSGIRYTNQIPTGYSNARTNFPTGSVGFPQWTTPPSSQRAALAGSPGNTIVQLSMAAAVAPANTRSSAAKASKLVAPSMHSTRKTPPTGPPVLAQSAQAQSQTTTQHHFFSNSKPVHQNSSSGGTTLSQRLNGEPNSMAQAMFPSELSMRRPGNEQSQPSLTVGGGNGPAKCSHPSAGGLVAVMAVSPYAQSAVNSPGKSAEQKPPPAC